MMKEGIGYPAEREPEPPQNEVATSSQIENMAKSTLTDMKTMEAKVQPGKMGEEEREKELKRINKHLKRGEHKYLELHLDEFEHLTAEDESLVKEALRNQSNQIQGRNEFIDKYLKRFSGLDHATIVNELIREGNGWVVVEYPERFYGLDVTAIAEKLIKARQGRIVAENPDKFHGLNYAKIAAELIGAGYGKAVVENLEKFQGLDIMIVEELIKEDQTRLVAYNIDKFQGVNKQELLNMLLSNYRDNCGKIEAEIIKNIPKDLAGEVSSMFIDFRKTINFDPNDSGKKLFETCEKVESLLDWLNTNKDIFIDVINNPPNKIEKFYSDDFSRSSYGLYCGEERGGTHVRKRTVYMFRGKNVRRVACGSSSRPLKFEDYKVRFDPGDAALRNGDFCTAQGVKILPSQTEFASDVFHQVETGIVILPDPKERFGYRIKIERAKGFGGEGEGVKDRTWGQQYLENLKPDNIKDAELLGSGGSYRAYYFGDMTIAEFDQEKHGTFVFKTDFFDKLREWSRGAMLQERPDGFIDRIIHKNNGREEWEKMVSEIVGKRGQPVDSVRYRV